MADVQLPNGDKLLKNESGQAIIWLPIGVKISLDIIGDDIAAPVSAASVDQRAVVPDSPTKVSVSNVYKAWRGLTFTLTATVSGVHVVAFRNSAGTAAASLVAVAGDVKNHPGMDIDLLADICRGSDPGKTLAVQRLLFNQRENIFDQNNDANERTYGHLACGKVVNGSGKALFGSMSPIFYEQPYHEPLNAVKSRSDVRYKADKIFKVRTAIKGFLAKGTPARVGVLDSPIRMYVQNQKLIAYFTGGHTTLIIGCNNSATRFLYVDTWAGGSKMKYEGGISGAVSQACEYMGIFAAQYDATRPVGKVDTSGAPNLLRQDVSTEGSFNTARGNYLEIVAGPVNITP